MITNYDQLAQSMGLPFIGVLNAQVQVKLTQEEKLEIGEAHAKASEKIRELEMELKDISNKLKGEIKGLQTDSYHYSTILNSGFKEETKKLPCFYDKSTNERVFANPETGEIISRSLARHEDKQLCL